MLDRIRCVALAVVLSTACHSWSAQSAPPEQAVAHAGAGPVRITRTDHSTVELAHVTVVQDSVIGTTTDASHARVAIPVADVQTVATREPNAARTVGLGIGIFFGAILGFALILAIAFSQANWS